MASVISASIVIGEKCPEWDWETFVFGKVRFGTITAIV